MAPRPISPPRTYGPTRTGTGASVRSSASGGAGEERSRIPSCESAASMRATSARSSASSGHRACTNSSLESAGSSRAARKSSCTMCHRVSFTRASRRVAYPRCGRVGELRVQPRASDRPVATHRRGGYTERLRGLVDVEPTKVATFDDARLTRLQRLETLERLAEREHVVVRHVVRQLHAIERDR